MQRRQSGRLQAAAAHAATAAATGAGAASGAAAAAPRPSGGGRAQRGGAQAGLPGINASLLDARLSTQLRAVAGAVGAAAAAAAAGADDAPAPAKRKRAPRPRSRAAAGGAGGAPAAPPKPRPRAEVVASVREPTKGVTQSTNKALSSRFRGVCWNRKNRRWQAAINVGGKYLYLGSFVDEDSAAGAFDRAAIKLRGAKAKTNFPYAGYVDAGGNLLEDFELPAPGGGGGGGGGGGRAPKASGSGGDGDGDGDGSGAKAGGAKARGGAKAGGGGAVRARKSARKPAAAAAAAPPAAFAPPDAPAPAPSMMASVGGGGALPGLFSSPLANFSMAEMRRLLGGISGSDGGGHGAAQTAAAAAAAAAAAPRAPPGHARGVTTGFTGPLPPVGPPDDTAASAFASLAGPSQHGGMPPPAAPWHHVAAQQEQQQQQQQLDAKLLPAIRAELGAGRAVTELVAPPPGLHLPTSQVRGVVYTQAPPAATAAAAAAAGGSARRGGGGATARQQQQQQGQQQPTFGAALWDGQRLVDVGARGSLEAALETAASLLVGEDDAASEAALRDLLGGPSGIVPRATSLALLQAIGSFRGELPRLDFPGAADDDGPPAKRTRSGTAAAGRQPSFFGGAGGSGGFGGFGGVGSASFPQTAKRARHDGAGGSGGGGSSGSGGGGKSAAAATAAAAVTAGAPPPAAAAANMDNGAAAMMDDDGFLLPPGGSRSWSELFGRQQLGDMLRALGGSFTRRRDSVSLPQM